MKAILVIDVPNKCNDCPLMSDDMYCKAFKGEGVVTKMCVEDYVMQGKRHPCCPLKRMPDKIPAEDIEDDMDVGWNNCIEELEK